MGELGIPTDAELLRRAGLPKDLMKSVRNGSVPRAAALIGLSTALEIPAVVVLYAAAGLTGVPPEEMPEVGRSGTSGDSLAAAVVREQIEEAAKAAFRVTSESRLRVDPDAMARLIASLWEVSYRGRPSG